MANENFSATRPVDYRNEQVTMELKDILIINQSILNNLRTQKARLDMSYDRYRLMIESEAKRPSNRFLEWTKILIPYQEMVMNSKVTDFELIKAYDNFVAQLIRHDKGFVIRKEELESKDEVIANLINKTIVGLEQSVSKLKRENESLKIQLNSLSPGSSESPAEEGGSAAKTATADPANSVRCKICGDWKPNDDGYASCRKCRDRMRMQRRNRKNEPQS